MRGSGITIFERRKYLSITNLALLLTSLVNVNTSLSKWTASYLSQAEQMKKKWKMKNGCGIDILNHKLHLYYNLSKEKKRCENRSVLSLG